MKIGSKMALLTLLLQVGWTLLPMTAAAAATAAAGQSSCEEVRYQCAFDSSCAEAMKHYFLMCDKQLDTDAKTCPEPCLYALVALTTTRHGQRLLDCTCRDSFCDMMKARVEVCRPLVTAATKNDTVVPCEMARWVCQVNQQCSVALEFHMQFCKKAHHNQSCPDRCVNSWNILRRQDNAFMLNRCRCAGRTALDCLRHKERFVKHCFIGWPEGSRRNKTVGSNRTGGDDAEKKLRKKNRPKGFEQDPDRYDVELMLNDPTYKPDLLSRQKPFDYGIKGSASAVRPWPYAVVVLQCSVAAAAALLVKLG